MTTSKLNFITWILLVILIILSYFFAETQFKYAAIVIGLLSLIKFYAVSFQFMETKEAHGIWKGFIIFIGFLYLSFIAFLY